MSDKQNESNLSSTSGPTLVVVPKPSSASDDSSSDDDDDEETSGKVLTKAGYEVEYCGLHLASRFISFISYFHRSTENQPVI